MRKTASTLGGTALGTIAGFMFIFSVMITPAFAILDSNTCQPDGSPDTKCDCPTGYCSSGGINYGCTSGTIVIEIDGEQTRKCACECGTIKGEFDSSPSNP
jgi:hypothetical protein